MKKLLSENRLKLASFFAVTGDFVLAFAGGQSYLLPGSINSAAGLCLFIGGVLGVAGHIALMLWGKGGKLEKKTTVSVLKLPVYLKPLKPWHYPLDFSFLFWLTGSFFYIAAGAISENHAMIIMGFFTAMAALIGWFWPSANLLFGFRSMQVSAFLYVGASISGLIAALLTGNLILLAAMCMYLICNIILYTVRKENQSLHTQAHEA